METAISGIFRPVQKESTREKVCEAIRHAILTGQLKTGRRLTEIPLAQEFQVSRAVVREALQQLSHEGFVQINSFKGARVVALTPEELDEIVHLRLILEPEAVRLAMGRLTAADKDSLERLARETDETPHTSHRYPQLDFGFHRRIWSLSGNGMLERHLVLLAAPLFVTGSIMRERSLAGTLSHPAPHVSLAEVIRNGTPEEAAEAMRNHIAVNWPRSRDAVKEFRQKEKAGRGRPKGNLF